MDEGGSPVAVPPAGFGARRLAANMASLVGAQAIVRVLALVSFPILVRSVADNVYGGYLYLLQLTGLVAVFVNFSLRLPFWQALERESDAPERPVALVLSIRLGLAALSVVGLLTWAQWGLATDRERWLLAGLLLASLLTSLGATFEEALQAKEQMRPTALASVLTGLCAAGGILVGAFVAGRPIVWAVLGQGLGSVLALWLTWSQATRLYQRRLVRLVWAPAQAWALLRPAATLSLAALIGALYGRIDYFVVKHCCGLGLTLTCYGVAWKAADVAMGAVMALLGAVVPRLTRLGVADEDELCARASTFIRLGLLALVPAALSVTALSHTIVRVFKPEDAPAAVPMAILIWMVPLVWTAALLHTLLYLRGRQAAVPWCLALGLAVDGGLCWLWTPRYGLPGAAAGSLLGEVTIVLVAALWLQRATRGATQLDWPALLAKPLAMAGAMAGVWTLVPGGWGGCLALAAYALAGALLRPLSAGEWAQLRSLRRAN